MSKADGKCNKCKGTGIVDSPVMHFGVPGGCYRCDLAGTYEAEVAKKAKAKAEKALMDKAYKNLNDAVEKISETKKANPEAAKMSREERHWAIEVGTFSTQEFADKFGYAKKDAWVKICASYPSISIATNWENGDVIGWGTR